MGDIKQELAMKVAGIGKNREPTISDVQQESENMNVIDKTMETARKLSGTSALEKQVENANDRADKAQKERDKAVEDKHKAEIEKVEEALGAKIDNLAKSYAGGASKDTIAGQIAEIKKAANELGMGTSKVSELQEMMVLIKSLNPQKSLAEQIQEAQALIALVQPEKKEEGIMDGMPASIALQVTKINADLQVTLEKMKDERQDRDQKFELEKLKWEEDRDIRRQQVDGEIMVQHDRNRIMADGIKMFGGAAGKAIADSMAQNQGVAAQPGGQPRGQPSERQTFHINLAEGETGTTECPYCHTPIGVGPEQTVAGCVGCNAQFEVKRTPAPVKQAPEKEEA